MYGRIVNGVLEYAPQNKVLENGGIIFNYSSNAESLKEDGYKLVVDNKLDYDEETQYIEFAGYTENENEIIVNYKRLEKSGLTTMESKIKETKDLLAEYLLDNPLPSKVKYTDGRYYAVTAEKQQQLTSKILMATMYQQMGVTYNLTWNDTGNICEPWEYNQLIQLSMEIDAYVTPLVKYQQELEVEIKNCKSVEEINNIVVDYNTVHKGSANEEDK